MDTTKDLSTWRLSRQKEAVLTALLGWVPLSSGRALRRLMYSAILEQIGDSVQIQPGVEFLHAAGIKIGNGVKIDRGVCIRNNGRNSRIYLGNYAKLDLGVIIKTHSSGNVEVGDYTYIGPYSCLSGNNIKIGQDCRLASHLGIYANNHTFADLGHKIRGQGNSYQGIVIENDCWLGSGVKVIDGVIIGQSSVIGAGAVVTKDIPPYSVAVGVPARVVDNRASYSEKMSKSSAES